MGILGGKVDVCNDEVATVDCGYLCKCGVGVFGDLEARKWARCVVCQRVVEREVGGTAGVVGVVGSVGLVGGTTKTAATTARTTGWEVGMSEKEGKRAVGRVG